MKKLSFVFWGRNDEYMGNSRYRMEVTLNFLVGELASLGRLEDVEIMVVDWGSEVPLHEVLEVTEEVRGVWRHLVVSKDIAEEAYPQNDFPRPHIMNAGIRRANGEYIVQSVADVLWTRQTLEKLFAIFEGKGGKGRKNPAETLFVVGRKEIPFEVASQELGVSDLARLIEKNDFPLYASYPFFVVAADGILAHRDLWFQSRGFDERLIHWGWNDVDLNLRMQLYYPVYSFYDDTDLNVYHLEHISSPKQIENRPTNPQVFNPFQVNDDGWGCGDFLFAEYPENPPVDVRQIAFRPLKKSFFVERFFAFVHQWNCLRFYWKYREAGKKPFLYYWRIVEEIQKSKKLWSQGLRLGK